MEKNVLKMYESPALDIVELEVKGFLCASDDPDMNGGADNVGGEGMGEEE